MYYYQFNIGDYASHTNNLSLLEDLAYRRLLDIYYRDEGLTECCEQEIARSIGMKDYQDEVSYILKKYFKKAKKGFKQSKADRDIKVYHSKADAARANGKLGGRPKKTQDKPSGLAEKTQSKTNQEPVTNNHKPITNNNKKDKIPYSAIAESYNNLFAIPTGNPEVRANELSIKRKTAIKKLWNLSSDSKSIDWFIKYFTHCASVPNMQSTVERSKGWENWRPSFDYLVRQDTLDKAREDRL